MGCFSKSVDLHLVSADLNLIVQRRTTVFFTVHSDSGLKEIHGLMGKSNEVPTIEQLAEHLIGGAHEDFLTGLEQYESAAVEERKNALQALRSLASEQPTVFTSILSGLVPFLTDQERSIRLTTTKLFVAIADAEPEAVSAVVPALADRLADEDEFYYVRARSAEALGYVALDDPDAVASPEILAELRIGLTFDEPEVQEKLAKALEYVALGRPQRLKHHVSTLADHLDDDNELVRYHLCTTLVVVGCEYPGSLTESRTALAARLDDENAYIRGRAAEALSLLFQEDVEETSVPRTELAALNDDEELFVAERAHFAINVLTSREQAAETPDEIGSVEAIRRTTDEVVEEITSPDGGCLHCGLELSENGPPMCPRCGAPY